MLHCSVLIQTVEMCVSVQCTANTEDPKKDRNQSLKDNLATYTAVPNRHQCERLRETVPAEVTRPCPTHARTSPTPHGCSCRTSRGSGSTPSGIREAPAEPKARLEHRNTEKKTNKRSGRTPRTRAHDSEVNMSIFLRVAGPVLERSLSSRTRKLKHSPSSKCTSAGRVGVCVPRSARTPVSRSPSCSRSRRA